MRDFAPIGPVGWYPNILVCNPRVPARSIQDLILLLRRNPGGIRYASAGPGTGNHFAGELFNLRAGVHIEHVPYRGSGPALQDTLAGVVDCTFDGAPHRYVASGELIALGTTGGERDPRLPEIPTFQESGVPDFQLVFWQGLAAPAAIPADRLVVLEDALRRALDDRGTRSRLYETGLTVQSGTAADLERMMRTDIARYREITELGGLHFE
jgi:tripartite-type tricarboxylate transporter receptor subunit TctC